MAFIFRLQSSIKKYAYCCWAVGLIWAKTYLVQRFGFDLPVEGFYQELILFINPASAILLILGTAMIILRGRPHAAVLLVSSATSIVLYINLIYYRCFNDFITISLLLQSNNLSDLWSSIAALTHLSDILLFGDTCLLLIWMASNKAKSPIFHRGPIISLFNLAIMLLLVNLLMAENVRPELLTRTFDRQIVVKSIGAFHYHVYDAVTSLRMESMKVFAKSEDLNPVESYLQQLPKDVLDPKMFGLARGRNVFLISMESLQSFVLNKEISGQAITPFLNSLLKESYYFDQFYHQTGQGKTSDAEFMVDTSLYPLPSGAVYFTHVQNTYDTMPDTLKKNGYTPVVFHANHPSFWNRNQMYRTMGYEKFYSSADYQITPENSVGWGLKDIPFFEQSVSKITALPKPFYSKLITLTNHYPFDLSKADRLIPLYKSSSGTLNHYIPSVRYMDEALKLFFDKVKTAGLYDNSIFVLYGDHNGISQKHNNAMAKLLDKPKITAFDYIELQRVPLIIHIPGQPGNVVHTVAGQVDLKPTLLHLLGIKAADSFSFGNDIFALNKPQFAVLRNGSFITDSYVYTKKACYDKLSGSKTNPSNCEPYKKRAVNALKNSDDLIYGDLLRFFKRKG
jgi:lipoteichoic acid synthase